MGHLVGKELYRELGRKIDNLSARTPWNEKLYAILKELYTPEEAEVVVKMPYSLSSFNRIARITKIERKKLRKILDSLCEKGLVMDLWMNNKYNYMPSPLVIGIFEFTMMRTGGNLNTKEWAKLFNAYMDEDDAFHRANYNEGDQIALLRTLPHVEAVVESEYVEVLDYDKITQIVENSDKFAVGICACRHEKLHLGKKECKVPLELCTSFGTSADIVIRNKFGREASKSEILEKVEQSKEMGLVFNADNVQKRVAYVCHCCGDCCGILIGFRKHRYPNIVITSRFIAEHDESTCEGCALCAKACPIEAIEMVPIKEPKTKKKKEPKIDRTLCLGCGVCVLKCKTGSLKLKKREQKIITPETTIERFILQCLERGTLQNQIFDDPSSTTQKYMRYFLGAFLNLSPVNRALTSDALRSKFLAAIKRGIKGKGMSGILKF